MNNNLHKAKKEKNDEYYTRLSDIEDEVKHYKPQFVGKVIYCNCDDPEWSNFFIYFRDNFKHLKLKKLISTHYTIDNENDKAYKLECVEIFNDENGKPDTKITYLKGDGDFRSEECVELLKECDIVCTNPPFSLFREFIAQIVEHDKKFLVIGNMQSVGYKEIFPLIKDSQIWLGVSPRSMKFIQPDKSLKSVNAVWFTNLSHKKRNEKIVLWKNFAISETEYKKYDNLDAIEVSKVCEIPIGYKGIMGVPITFLEKFNPIQFDIVGFRKGDDNKDLRINGVDKATRIIIKHKEI